MTLQEYLLHLEKNLLVGSGRWVANFNESFRDYYIGDTRFDMLVRGQTRSGGFLLSRLFAYFALPNYQVACFVYTGELRKGILYSLINTIQKYMKANDLTWSWLVLPKEGPFPQGLIDVVRKMDIREIGIALLDLDSGTINTNPSYLGRKMVRYVRAGK